MTKLKKIDNSSTAETVVDDDAKLAQWYWVTDDDEEWLGCVTHLGSNYTEITSIDGSTVRVHVDQFHSECRLEPDASRVIQQNIHGQKEEVRRLMAEVEALTARLGVGSSAALPSGESEGHALAKLDTNVDVGAYKTALIKAKDQELPELFKEIEDANRSLAKWMKAETLPMRAQVKQMKGALDLIENRIFNVELYAGLTEEVELIVDGEPAKMTEKIRLMQRRCYMDEECLVEYQAGGMEFKDLRAFDSWLAQPEHRDRILPFPRCIVAFRVRRHDKYREIHSYIDFFRAVAEMEADRLTFLYIRNGEKIYRMNTQLEFGEQLFPDTNHHWLTAGTKLWAKTFAGRVDQIITDDQYQGLIEEHKRKEAEHKTAKREHKAKHKAWRDRKKAAKAAGEDFDEREPWLPHFWSDDPSRNYEPFETDNIYYDDIQKKIADEMRQYNRIGIIIQGLLDRSPVLHPHPPWKIWSRGGSSQALEFVYDASRALVGGEKPDFAAYHKRVNASLKTGSVTVGQHRAWLADEEHGEKRRNQYGNPGPAMLERVAKYEPRKKRCVYAWHRDGTTYDNYGKKFRTTATIDQDQVFNVDAYTPGDFRRFFEDPRTRAEYLQWAPWLLEAEEYHAGNRKVPEPPEPAPKTSTWAGRLAYERRKQHEKFLGKRVRLVRAIATTGEEGYAAGTLWKVVHHSSKGLTIQEEEGDRRRVSRVQPDDLEVVPEG